ncbi:MAG TPA: polyphosphate kinase [Cytophagales bacterium]|nr:polyphosphate kinase [Cytophagales bacterium]HAA19490.1 polyphosphate kinase [Cytophagales bacterium]HAP59635.1 polyphosphate kinase [Cytophagales bacterium]
MEKLINLPTRAPEGLDKEHIKAQTKKLRQRMFDLQHKMYIQGKYSVLVILQGVDTSGKDGTIRNVFSGVNPMGCRVKSFKKPTELEEKHDFLWRVFPHFPEAGKIQLFNRSYYEDIIMPQLYWTHSQEVIDHRYTMINALEQHLVLNNTRVIKLLLHISSHEQWARIESRITEPHKRWKYHPDDKKAAERYGELLAQYDLIRERCSEPVPWEVIPADQKWYRNFLVAKRLVDELEALEFTLPESQFLDEE